MSESSRTLLIFNLPKSVKIKSIIQLFRKYGKIENYNTITNSRVGNEQVVFIRYSSILQCENAYYDMNFESIEDIPIYIQFHREKFKSKKEKESSRSKVEQKKMENDVKEDNKESDSTKLELNEPEKYVNVVTKSLQEEISQMQQQIKYLEETFRKMSIDYNLDIKI